MADSELQSEKDLKMSNILSTKGDGKESPQNSKAKMSRPKGLPRREFQGAKLDKIGIVPTNYKNPRRWVKPEGLVLVRSPALALKFYRMMTPKEQRFADMLVGSAKKFIEEQTRCGNLEPLLGMGFAILSEDMLNVVRWDTQYPIVGRNNLYAYDNGDISTIKKLDIRREVGAFCLWEDRIKVHEGIAWAEYLSSRRGNGSKRRYLSDFLPEGSLAR